MDNINTSQSKGEATLNKKRRTIRRILCIVAAVLLLGSLATVGWLYYNATQTIRDQKALISDLQKRLRDLGVDIPASPGEGDADAASCNGGSTYSADIGNFDLSVSDPNVIIRNLDANFEGGPISDLTIGRCVTGETNVVDTYPTHKVNILAHPAANAATLRANFEAEWGSPLTPGAPITIDGVATQTYTGSGLFTTKLVYFDHGGIGYQIELPDVNPTTEAILTDVISDWAFTP